MAQPCDFRLLGENLQIALETNENDLVADSSHKLYERSSIKGRNVFFMNKWLSFFNGTPHFIQEQRKAAFMHTRSLFEKGMEEISHLSVEYKNALNSLSTPVVAKRCRGQISFIVDSLKCLRGTENSFSFTERLQKIDALFAQVAGEEEGASNKIDTAATRSALVSLETDFALQSVQGVLQIAYPLSVFRKLIQEVSLTEHDVQEIKEWITVVNRKEERLSSRLMHRALWGIVEICLGNKAQEKEISEKVCTLEWFLFHGKCAVLEGHDWFHQKWCDTLYAGKMLDQEKKIVLGEEVYYPPLANLGLRLFWCQDAPEKMIMVSNNYSTLGIWYASSFRMTTKSGAWAVPLLNVHHIDKEGRYLVVEAIVSSLLDVDVRKSKVDLVPFLAWLGEQEWAPRTLSLDQIFVNHEGSLRTFVPFALEEAMPFSFARIEQFVWESSHKDSDYFQILMRASGLAKHSVAQWYQKMSRLFLQEGNRFTLEEYALRQKITKGEQEKAQELINLLKQSVGQVLTAFLSLSQKEGKKQVDRAGLKKRIVEEVLAVQEKFCFFSFAAPDLVKKVIAAMQQ